jgi:hypothetical protein
VTLSTPSASAVSVHYGTASGTAISGSDFTGVSGTLTFPASATSRFVAVAVAGDTTFETNETFTLKLSSAVGATIWRTTGVGTIANDDPGLCGAKTTAPTRYDHVIWIVFENADYGDIIGKSTMPYVNHLATKCGSATQMFAEQHPSAPNYIAMVSGSTQGQPDDSNPAFQYSANNLFHQVQARGQQWRNYSESMPSNCRTSDYTAPSETGPIFTAHHEPAPYFKLNQTACASGWCRWATV